MARDATWDREEKWQNRVEKVVTRIYQSFPSPEFENWETCAELTLSVINVFEKIVQFDIKNEDTAFLLNQAALYLIAKAEYKDGESLLQRSIAIYQNILGENTPIIANGFNSLAKLYQLQGKYYQAESIYKNSLNIREEYFGKNHLDVAQTLNDIAELYRITGKYKEAENLCEKSLKIREKFLNSSSPYIAECLNNLAEIYRIQGKYNKSEELYQKSLSIREKYLGENHPDVAHSLNNLAELYRIQGKYEKSEKLYQRSLTIREKYLGENHPDVAQSLNNLAELYKAQQKYDFAESLYLKSLKILEFILGNEHSEIATVLNNIALLYDIQRKFEQAEPLYQKSLSIWKKSLGENHPNVANCMNNLAMLYYVQGKFEQAEPLYQKSLAINETILGSSHPSIALTLNNLAGLYDYQGKYEQATLLYQRSLVIFENSLGQEHPTTQAIKNNLQQVQNHNNRAVIMTGGNTIIGRDNCYNELQKEIDDLRQINQNYIIKIQELELLIQKYQKSNLPVDVNEQILDQHDSNLIRFNETLLNLVKTAIERPITIINENRAMIDKSRHQSIDNSPISNSNIIFGDNNTLTNAIQQLPVEHTELKNLLNQLQSLINDSTLPNYAKKEALSGTKTIAEVVKLPEEEQQSVVHKTLSYFKGLSDDIKDIPEIATKWGETIAQIALLFGV